MVVIQKPKCEIFELTTNRTSSESYPHLKDQFFYKNLRYFRIIADFEADNETDNSSRVNKTTNIYKQNPVCNGYCILSELEDVSKLVIMNLP